MKPFIWLGLIGFVAAVGHTTHTTTTTTETRTPIRITFNRHNQQPPPSRNIKITLDQLGGNDKDLNVEAKEKEKNEATDDVKAGHGKCIGLHGRCNFVAAVNAFAKKQCCKGLYCQLSIFEGIFWPTFACTNLKEKLGLGKEDPEEYMKNQNS